MSVRDPGAATGARDYPTLPPCANCPHSPYLHTIPEGKHVRTSCSSWRGGRCRCEQYTAKEGT